MPPLSRLSACVSISKPRLLDLRCYNSTQSGDTKLGFLESKPKFKPFNSALSDSSLESAEVFSSASPLFKDGEWKQSDKGEEAEVHQNEIQPSRYRVAASRTHQRFVHTFGIKEGSRKIALDGDSASDPSIFDWKNAPYWKNLDLKKARAAPGSRMLHRQMIVTGGSSGIGFAIAKRFIEEGASSVGIISRSRENLSRAIQSIKDQTGSSDAPVWGICADINDRENIRHVLDFFATSKERRGIDTLVNCAGLSQSKLLVSTNAEDRAAILSTNLESAIALSKCLVRQWTAFHRRNKLRVPEISGLPAASGPESYNIVNVSSLLALKGGTGASVYAASKAGLIAFSRALVLEVADMSVRYKGPGSIMRVNTVIPGFIDTPMVADLPEKAREQVKAQIPVRRLGTPDEVADAVVFLVSNEYANNCVLNLDGGLSAT